MIECLHCGKWWVEQLLKRWQDGVAFWCKEHMPSTNPNFFCPSCLDIQEKERCIHCSLHWPAALVWRRCCPLCKKRIKQKNYPAMTEARFSKLYREV